MRHIGLLGGTFNPVHIGHLLVAESVLEQLELDEIRFLPAARSPFKQNPDIDDRHRLAMLELALADRPGFRLDPRELDRPPPSYTIDTLRLLVDEHPRDRFYLMIGMDAWQSFEGWKQWPLILELCHLVVMTRPGYVPEPLAAHWQQRLIPGVAELRATRAGGLMFVTVPASDAASSTLRSEIELGRDTGLLLHPAVKRYIEQRKLYRLSQ